MNQWTKISIAAAALSLLVGGPARAADEDAVTRAKEMLRRTQEALHQAQADNAELSRSKEEAEQKLQAASKQLDAEKGSSRSALAALQGQLQAAQAAQTELQRRYADVSARLTETTAKLAEASKQLSAKSAEAVDLASSLDRSKTQNASCESKNVALYQYATQALQLYQHKGVWAAVSQKEPVLGLKNVQVQNVVQEYQLKIDADRVKP
jgi:DNA repair exonuclease SbcCD ATPase subunit